MFSKSNLLATLAGFVVMFLLGYTLWDIVLADFFESHTLKTFMNEELNMPLIAGSNLIAAFALSTIYGKWARGHHSVKEGFEYGAWIGVFTGFGIGLLNQAVMGLMDMTGTLVNGIVEVLFYGLIGIVISLVYKATSKKSTS